MVEKNKTFGWTISCFQWIFIVDTDNKIIEQAGIKFWLAVTFGIKVKKPITKEYKTKPLNASGQAKQSKWEVKKGNTNYTHIKEKLAKFHEVDFKVWLNSNL